MFGDIDGVVVIPFERLEEVLRLSEEHAAVENEARRDFVAPGADVEAVYRKYRKL
jgi:regulator of RNase E activity RraA